MKTLIEEMCEIRDLSPSAVVKELSTLADKGGVQCPVPGCDCSKTFKRWGDMRGHFLDDTAHKKDYFRAYKNIMGEDFSASSGPDFNHGINSLMLALLRRPTPVHSMNGMEVSEPEPKPKTTTKPKKARPLAIQRNLLEPSEPLPEPKVVDFVPVAESFAGLGSAIDQPAMASPSVELGPSTKTRAFQRVADLIREGKKINHTWRVKMLDFYIEMFHGIPPCFHCRSAEGKQIHHQNPLFHEIVLLMLNKLGTTSEEVIREFERGNKELFTSLEEAVYQYHEKPGRVLAVPYCQDCNKDAESRRKAGKTW